MASSRAELTLAQFAQQMQNLPDAMEGAIIRGLRSAAMRGVTDVVEAINTAKPYPVVDRGELAGSVEATSLPKGGRISVDAPHAAVMETGSRPFWPPLQPLIDWVLRKGLAEDEDEAEEMALGIQKKFAFVGIEPRHYFRRAMVRVRKHIPIEVESELAQMSRVIPKTKTQKISKLGKGKKK